MYGNWAEIRSQLEQGVESERIQRQARRHQQQPLWQSLRHRWRPAFTALTTLSLANRATSVRLPGGHSE
jgi:hypothetical protein